MAYLSPDHKTREQQPSASDKNWKKRHPDTLFWVLQRNRTSRCKYIIIGSAQSLSRVWLCSTPWTAARQASLSITNSWSTFKLTSVASVMLSNRLIVVPFSSHLQSFQASGSYPMSWFFASGGQSIGVSASASVLPMNNQDWFPLGLTGWSSLPSMQRD